MLMRKSNRGASYAETQWMSPVNSVKQRCRGKSNQLFLRGRIGEDLIELFI